MAGIGSHYKGALSVVGHHFVLKEALKTVVTFLVVFLVSFESFTLQKVTMATSRKRSSNFSKREELALLEEVEKFKDIIECKITNRITCLEKNEAWKEICNNCNARLKGERTPDQMKGKFENLKVKARKMMANNKLNFKSSSGSPLTVSLNDPVLDAVLNIINSKSAYGMEFTGDSDVSEEYLEVPEIDEPAQPASIAEEENSDHNMIGILFEPNVNPNENKTVSPPQKNLKRIAKPTRKNLRWRPTVRNPVLSAKAEFYRAKTRLIEAEIVYLKRKAEREEEEHGQKEILMDLEIAKAQSQL